LLETIDRQDVKGNEQFFRQCAQYMGDFCETAMKESDQLLAYLDNDTAEAQSVKDCNIAILGPKNTYSELALRSYDRKAKPYYAKTISEVFELVASGKIQEGLVPLENSSSGSVRETLDELYHEPVGIDKVIAQKIELALVGQKKIALSRIKRIYSHQQPLLQSYAFIKKHCSAASLMPVFSTTEAIRRTIREGKGEVAAIASESAAKALGLTVLRHRIQDDNNNTTLFALIKKISKTDSKKGKKTSIAFHFGKDAPGSLHGILELFAKAGINLSKIESRPNRKLRGEYVFYLDFEKGLEDKAVQGVLKTIEAKVSHLKVLGSY
jgi:prephenate dehydratase